MGKTKQKKHIYKVTHPQITTEHVLGAATALFFAFAGFLAHAITDLARDACGAVIPSLCGTRESRLVGTGGAAVVPAGRVAGGAATAGSDGGVEAARVGEEGNAPVLSVGGGGGGEIGGGEEAEGHELDQYFFL